MEIYLVLSLANLEKCYDTKAYLVTYSEIDIDEMKVVVLEEVNVIAATLYRLMIIAICLLSLYIVCFTDICINIISSILLNLFNSILVIIFNDYILFYTNLIVLPIISYRYFKNNNKIDLKNMVYIFVVNSINITISLNASFKIMYLNNIRVSTINIFFIEAAPIAYMIMVYILITLLILAFYSHLSININNNVQLITIKIAVIVIFIVLFIIVVNAVMFFIIHNYPFWKFNGAFNGNFLKDPIKYYYRLAKPFSDCLWFSATTFFTVGYGDMHPVGNIMYLLSMMEMISAYALGIITIPILLFKISNK